MKRLHHQYFAPHIHKKRFYNYQHERRRSFLLDSLKMMLKSLKHRRQAKKDALAWHSPDESQHDLSCVWIGHATFLLTLDGYRILTDPIFGNLSWFFPRLIAPGIKLKELPDIHAVLISHNHRDHMDEPSLKVLKRFNPVIAVPLGVKPWFGRRNFKNVYEYSWWQKHRIIHPNGKLISLHFLPAHHWSQRGIFDKNRSLWGSWMIEYDGRTIYFAGDSAHAAHFSMIGEKYKRIDYALLPIGPCEPREHMQHSHLGAYEAVEAFKELNAQTFIPMHWGTFPFGVDTLSRPIDLLQEAWREDPFKTLLVPKAGQVIKLL